MMVEWYWVGDDMFVGMKFFEEFIMDIFGSVLCELCSYWDVFLMYVGIDLFNVLDCELFGMIEEFLIDVFLMFLEFVRDLVLDLFFLEVV